MKLFKAKKGQSMSSRLVLTISALVGSIVGLILAVSIVGNSSVVTQINTALTNFSGSGWPLASLFDPSSGIITLIIVVGVLIMTIGLALGIGAGVVKSRK